MKLSILTGLFVLCLLIQATALTFYDEGYDTNDLNFNATVTPSVGFKLVDGVPTTVNLRLFNYWLDQDPPSIKVVPYPATASPEYSTNLSISCDSQNNANWELSAGNNWLLASWARGWIGMSAGDINQTITSNQEASAIRSSNNCTFTAEGQDLFVSFYFPLYSYDIYEAQNTNTTKEGVFKVPNQALNNITKGMSNILNSGFELAEMLLIVSGMIIFFFVIVFVWKLIEYFASRISRRETR